MLAGGADKEGRVVVRVEQVNLDRGAPFSFANIGINVGLSLERSDLHANPIGAFSVQFRWVLDADPAARWVDLEGARLVVEHVLELRVLALVAIGGKHLEHGEAGRQILDDRYVVHVVLELCGVRSGGRQSCGGVARNDAKMEEVSERMRSRSSSLV